MALPMPRLESCSSCRSARSDQLHREHVPSGLELKIKRVVEAHFGRDLQERFAFFARHSTFSNAQVVCVGPTKAGKSTLVNGIFGRVIVPTGVLPETVLPVGFCGVAEAVDSYEIRSCGEGLDAFLDMLHPLSGRPGRISGLTASQTFRELKRLNSLCREKIRAADAQGAASQFREKHPKFESWRLDVLAPSVFANFTIVDCPGGSEHGLLGDAIQAFLRHQVGQACLALLVVKANNIVPLTDSTGVASFFGGNSQSKDVVVVVNAVEEEKTRKDAEKLLGQTLTKSCLGNLRQRKTCYMSGQALLGFSLLKSKFPQLLRQARGPVTVEQFLEELELSHYAERLEDEGYEDVDILAGMAKTDELEQVLIDDIAMTAEEATKLINALSRDSETLPEINSEEFKQSRDELRVMFETVFRTADFASMYDRVRNDLPSHIQKTFLARYADTSGFHTFLIEFIAKERVKLIAKHMLDSALLMAKEELRRLDLEVISAEQTIEEAQADLEKFERKCQPAEIEGFKHFIREELSPLVADSLKGLPDVKSSLEAAAKLFGTCEQMKLTADHVRRSCGEMVAVSWMHNVNKARQGDAALASQNPSYMFGVESAGVSSSSHMHQDVQEAGSFGRLLRSKARTKAVAGAFQQWCVEEVVAGILANDCPGDRTYWCMRRWLERELGEVLGAAVAGSEEDSEFCCSVSNLPVSLDKQEDSERSVIETLVRAGAGRLAHLVIKPTHRFWTSDALDALGSMGKAQYWLGVKPSAQDQSAADILNFADVAELKEDFWISLIETAKEVAVDVIVEAKAVALQESLLAAAETRRAAAGCWRASLHQDGQGVHIAVGRSVCAEPIAEICTLGGDLVLQVPDGARGTTVAQLKREIENLTQIPVREQELMLGRTRLTYSGTQPLKEASAAAPVMISLVRRPGCDSCCQCPDEEQHEFLEWAKDYQWDKVKEMLVVSPSLVNVQPAGRWSALHQASDSGDVDAVASLLALRADPELRNNEGLTPKEVTEDHATRQILELAEAQFAKGLQIQDLGEKRRTLARALQQLEALKISERLESW